MGVNDVETTQAMLSHETRFRFWRAERLFWELPGVYSRRPPAEPASVFRVGRFASAAERMQGERSEHASLGDVGRRDRSLLSSKMGHYVIGERRYFHV